MTNEAMAKIMAHGKLWEVEGKKRIYINDINELAGLVITRYGSGSISSATFNGEKISNSRAGKLSAYAGSKLWFDFADEKFYSKNLNDETFSAAVANIIK